MFKNISIISLFLISGFLSACGMQVVGEEKKSVEHKVIQPEPDPVPDLLYKIKVALFGVGIASVNSCEPDYSAQIQAVVIKINNIPYTLGVDLSADTPKIFHTDDAYHIELVTTEFDAPSIGAGCPIYHFTCTLRTANSIYLNNFADGTIANADEEDIGIECDSW